MVADTGGTGMDDDLIGVAPDGSPALDERVAQLARALWDEFGYTLGRNPLTVAAFCVPAAVAAHTDYLLALGGVTRMEIVEALAADDQDTDATESLIARAVAQAVADKDAKLTRVEALLEPWLAEPSPTSMPRPAGAVQLAESIRAALADEDGGA